jgi:hypothetical protein
MSALSGIYPPQSNVYTVYFAEKLNIYDQHLPPFDYLVFPLRSLQKFVHTDDFPTASGVLVMIEEERQPFALVPFLLAIDVPT